MNHMTRLDSTVDQIFEQLRKAHLIVADRRQPGIASSKVEEQLHGLGLQAPQDLIQLYGLCDGTATGQGEILGKISFFPGFYWMSLNECVATYSAISQDARWNKSWFPIFGNGGGDFYAVICDADSPYFGEVVGFLLGEVDQIVEFKNVETMFAVICRSFDDGAFFLQDGTLEADYSKMRAIARQLQPDFAEHDA